MVYVQYLLQKYLLLYQDIAQYNVHQYLISIFVPVALFFENL